MAAATLLELQTAITDGGLRNRIQAALCKTAVSINFEGAGAEHHTERFLLAGNILKGDINSYAAQALKYVVAGYTSDHPTDDLATLLAMTDSQLQNYVDAAAGVLAGLS